MHAHERGYNLRSYILVISGSVLALDAVCVGAMLLILVLIQPALFTGRNFVTEPIQVSLLASGLIALGCLTVPVVLFSVQNLLGRPQTTLTPRGLRWWEWIVLPIAWIGILILATTLFTNKTADWAIPALQILGVVLPVYIFVRVAAAGIQLGTHQHAWGAFTSGMTFSPFLSAFIEIALVLMIIFGLGIYLAMNPQISREVEMLVQRLERANDIEQVLSLLAPLLRNPLTLFGALFYFSILTPLVEEPVKSLGVWLGFDRLRSPAQGFGLGALCGAGFAVTESMFATFSPGETWGVTFLTRSASGLMHIAVSALIGWGIAQARLSRRYMPLLGTYALGIAIHGLWNGAAIAIVAGGLRLALNALSYEVDLLGIVMTLGGIGVLFLMIVAIAVFLSVFNHRLRRENPPQPPNETVPAQSGEAV